MSHLIESHVGFHEYRIRRAVLHVVLKASIWFEHTI